MWVAVYRVESERDAIRRFMAGERVRREWTQPCFDGIQGVRGQWPNRRKDRLSLNRAAPDPIWAAAQRLNAPVTNPASGVSGGRGR